MKKLTGKKYMRFWVEGLFILLFAFICYINFGAIQESKPSLTYTQFMQAANDDKIQYISLVRGSTVVNVHYKDGHDFTTVNLGNDTFLKDLADKGVGDIRTQNGSKYGAMDGIVSSSFMLVFMYVMVRGFSNIFGSVTKAISKTSDSNKVDSTSWVTFADVAGMTEEKEELMSAVDSIRSGDKLKERGMRPIKGVLLNGPPGVGKTLLAKAIAGEAGVKFLSFSGAGFMEMYVGVGAMRVRAMYKQAVENKPCVVFIDEIDSVGVKRSNNGGGGVQESNNTLTALLEKMDGIGTETGILFVGATNRIDALDSALTRPGRFDKIIHIGPPKSKEDREAIVAVHMRGKSFKEGVTAERIGKLFFGMTGAQIEASLNDAIMESFKAGEDGVIDIPHIDNAMMKLVVRGVAKGKHTGDQLERVAVHEIGHALMYQKLGKRVVKVAVQPYSSGVGGVTMIDNDDSNQMELMTRQDFMDNVKVLYAGMVAEQVVLGDFSNGNSNDLERATQLLHNMVAFLGMADGSILSASYLSNFGNSPAVSNEVLSKMETLGARLRKEVEDYFSQPLIKDRVILLAKELAQKEVIYDLPEQETILTAV